MLLMQMMTATTAGNTSTVVFNNIYVNPDEGVLEFYATVNAEVRVIQQMYILQPMYGVIVLLQMF